MFAPPACQRFGARCRLMFVKMSSSFCMVHLAETLGNDLSTSNNPRDEPNSPNALGARRHSDRFERAFEKPGLSSKLRIWLVSSCYPGTNQTQKRHPLPDTFAPFAGLEPSSGGGFGAPRRLGVIWIDNLVFCFCYLFLCFCFFVLLFFYLFIYLFCGGSYC